MNTSSARRRLAFTLIEMLVVIAIIVILVGLLMAGVVALMRKGPETVSKQEISQLSLSLDNFKATFKQYPPSRITLARKVSQMSAADQAWIQTFWPNISTTTDIPWLGYNSSGADIFAATYPTGGPTLHGDQCLVFFLGGPPKGQRVIVSGKPTSPGLQGFSNDPKNPANPLPPGDRKKFYDFDVGRLSYFRTDDFPSYVDGWGKLPYIYFGSGKRADGYDPTWTATTPLTITPFNVSPYYATDPTASSPPTGYYNASKFQLISAGADGAGNGGFGPGGKWTPATASTVSALGRDDISNFHDKVLGSQ